MHRKPPFDREEKIPRHQGVDPLLGVPLAGQPCLDTEHQAEERSLGAGTVEGLLGRVVMGVVNSRPVDVHLAVARHYAVPSPDLVLTEVDRRQSHRLPY